MFSLRSTTGIRTLLNTTHHCFAPACAVSVSSSWAQPQSFLFQHQPQHQQNRSLKSWARKQELRKRIQSSLRRQHEPTMTEASTMPLSYQAMKNDTLIVLGRMDIHAANTEILKRHIMVVDGTSYQDASNVYEKISKANKEHMFLLALPYQAGIFTAITAGIVSIPMVFQKDVALWFNRGFVTTDVPEPADLETFWEVGAWSWNWMEPALGTVSFVLLALQFSRAQIQNLGITPYTKRIKQWRAERLATAFPKYDTAIVMAYSKSATLKNKRNQV